MLTKFPFMSQKRRHAFFVTLPTAGRMPGRHGAGLRVFSNRNDQSLKDTIEPQVRDQTVAMDGIAEGARPRSGGDARPPAP